MYTPYPSVNGFSSGSFQTQIVGYTCAPCAGGVAACPGFNSSGCFAQSSCSSCPAGTLCASVGAAGPCAGAAGNATAGLSFTCVPYTLKPGCFSLSGTGNSWYEGTSACAAACGGAACPQLGYSSWPSCLALSPSLAPAIASVSSVPSLARCVDPTACFADASCLGGCGNATVCAWASGASPCSPAAPGYACLAPSSATGAACFASPTCGGACGPDSVCRYESPSDFMYSSAAGACSSGVYLPAPPPPAPPPPTVGVAPGSTYCFLTSASNTNANTGATGQRCSGMGFAIGDNVTLSICASDGGLCRTTPSAFVNLLASPLAGTASGTVGMQLSCAGICSQSFVVNYYLGSAAVSAAAPNSTVDVNSCTRGDGTSSSCVGAVVWYSPLMNRSAVPPAPPPSPLSSPAPPPPPPAATAAYRCLGTSPGASCFADSSCFGACDPSSTFCGLSPSCSGGAAFSPSFAPQLSGAPLYSCLGYDAAPAVAGCAASGASCFCPGGACVQDATGTCPSVSEGFLITGCPSNLAATCGRYYPVASTATLRAYGCPLGSLFGLGTTAAPRFVALLQTAAASSGVGVNGGWLIAATANSGTPLCNSSGFSPVAAAYRFANNNAYSGSGNSYQASPALFADGAWIAAVPSSAWVYNPSYSPTNGYGGNPSSPMPSGFGVSSPFASSTSLALPTRCVAGAPTLLGACATSRDACATACAASTPGGSCFLDVGSGCGALRSAIAAADAVGNASRIAPPTYACIAPTGCFPLDATCGGLCAPGYVCGQASTTAPSSPCAGSAVAGFTCRLANASCYSDAACTVANGTATSSGAAVGVASYSSYGYGSSSASSNGLCPTGTVCSPIGVAGACAFAPAAVVSGGGFVCVAPALRCYTDAGCGGRCAAGTVCALDAGRVACPASAAGSAAGGSYVYTCLSPSSCFSPSQPRQCASACYGAACVPAFMPAAACGSGANPDPSLASVLVCEATPTAATSHKRYILNMVTSIPAAGALVGYIAWRLGAVDALRKTRRRVSSVVGPMVSPPVAGAHPHAGGAQETPRRSDGVIAEAGAAAPAGAVAAHVAPHAGA